MIIKDILIAMRMPSLILRNPSLQSNLLN